MSTRSCVDIVGGQTLFELRLPVKIEVHRVGVHRLFSASRLGDGEFGPSAVGQPRDDLVLHIEEIGDRLVEPLRPEMRCRFRRRSAGH